MTFAQHGIRIVLLMALATGVLGWISRHTEILFADGLRYIDQAQRLASGELAGGLLRSVDHPIYPLSIAAAHGALGGDGPLAWQAAAQDAAVFAGILLVIPLYLIGLELFGQRSAWLGTALVFLTPLNGRVMADALSESTFLLFWMWGLWAALRFLREGRFAWLPLTIGFSILAYLTRPEGLLLPAALVATLGAMPLLRATRMNWPRWWAAVAFLVIGPGLVVGPYAIAKGGLGTKPAIARLLGTAPKAPAGAVERSRPLDPGQSTVKTYAVAGKAMFEAIRDSVSLPLLPLALVGIWTCGPFAPRARTWLLLAIILAAAMLALVRLHATAGYCTARHAMLLGTLLILAAGAGLDYMLDHAAVPARWLGQGEGRMRPGPAVWLVAIVGYLAWSAPTLFTPLNADLAAYRLAGDFVAKEAHKGDKVADLTGWSLFYGQVPGYTFATIEHAAADPTVRWVVAREAHMKGPWPYCQQLRDLVGNLKPVETFPAEPKPRQSLVYVFDRRPGGEVAGRDAGARR